MTLKPLTCPNCGADLKDNNTINEYIEEHNQNIRNIEKWKAEQERINAENEKLQMQQQQLHQASYF